jgi:hypothetical protein
MSYPLSRQKKDPYLHKNSQSYPLFKERKIVVILKTQFSSYPAQKSDRGISFFAIFV